VPDSVTIRSVRVEPGKTASDPAKIVVTGRGAPGVRVEVGIDGANLATATVAADGSWTVEKTQALSAGAHSASVRTRDIGGAVIAQHAFGFDVPSNQIAAVTPEKAPATKQQPEKEAAKSPVSADKAVTPVKPDKPAATAVAEAKAKDQAEDKALASRDEATNGPSVANSDKPSGKVAKSAKRQRQVAMRSSRERRVRHSQRHVRTAQRSKRQRATQVASAQPSKWRRVYIVRGNVVDAVLVRRGSYSRFVGDRDWPAIAKRRANGQWRLVRRHIRMLGGRHVQFHRDSQTIMAFTSRAWSSGRRHPNRKIRIR
jgi:hypothetical protein